MEMQKIKYVYSDLDDTIVQRYTKNRYSYRGQSFNDLAELSPKTKEIIKVCHENNIGFGLATGRSYQKTYPIVYNEKITMPVICCDGTQVFYKNKLALSVNLPKGLVYAFNRIINRNHKLEFFIVGGFMTFTSENSTWITDEEEMYLDKSFFPMNDFLEVRKLRSDAEWNLSEVPINTIILAYRGMSRNEMQEMDRLAEQYKVKLVKYNVVMQILPLGVSKATGLEYIRKHLIPDLTPHNTATFGDGINDIEMLEWSDYGIAMDNAKDSLRKVAKQICPSISDDGLTCWIEKEVLKK